MFNYKVCILLKSGICMGEGDDVSEALSLSYYNCGPGADTFNCSAGPGAILQDYNSGEGDTVSAADCETVKGTTLTEPIQTVLTLNTITSVPWGKDVTVITGKIADPSQAGGVRGKTITFDGTAAENIPDVVTNTSAPNSTVPRGKTTTTTSTATLKDASLGGVPIEGKTIHFDGTGVIGVSN
jgi:hypothetical protein